MTPAPPLPQEVWDATPPEARALITAVLLQVEALRAEVATLKARLDANSQNSSRPPSSDPPHVKRQPPRPATGRKRGGQPGHQRSVRPMVPPERLTHTVDCIPSVCPCGAALAGVDPAPYPHQVAELPEVRPDVVEYRLHRLVCPACRRATRAALPPGVPAGAFGPHLLATVALLTGRYRLSKRLARAALGDLLGLSVSVGMVSKAERRADAATAGPVEEVARAVAVAPALNDDETGWRQGRERAWLWTAVGPGMTLSRVDRLRGADALRRLVGEAVEPVITSDRPHAKVAPGATLQNAFTAYPHGRCAPLIVIWKRATAPPHRSLQRTTTSSICPLPLTTTFRPDYCLNLPRNERF